MLVGGDYLRPSEFWALDRYEIWWLIEAKQKQQRAAAAIAAGATLTEDQYEELYEGLENMGVVGGG